uniref:Uncharacterized protein n=1 Tax=Siphoviridae sp. ctDiR9 TaxID=2825388 RepID=A0A8S5PP72_9CAUD|nr:MAG TPA: hypothetical protein [Siphoviridae sp. ctDiR9]
MTKNLLYANILISDIYHLFHRIHLSYIFFRHLSYLFISVFLIMIQRIEWRVNGIY